MEYVFNQLHQKGLPNKFHALRKLYYGKHRIEQHINFIHNCLKQDLIPNFIKLKTTPHLKKHMPLIHKKLLKISLKELYSKLNIIFMKIKYIHSELANINHYKLIFDTQLYEIQQQAIEDNREDDLKRSRKLSQLRKNQKKHQTLTQLITQHPTTTQHVFPSRFTNLRNVVFNKDEIQILTRSDKYGPPPTASNAPIPSPIITAIELEAQLHKQNEYQIIKTNTLPFLLQNNTIKGSKKRNTSTQLTLLK